MSETIWSDQEKQVARNAFQKAYERETNALITQLAEMIKEVENIYAVWEIHDYLSSKRHQIDGRYYLNIKKYSEENTANSEYSTLIFLFAELFKEKWLCKEDLVGLSDDKISKIVVLSFI